MPVYMSAHMFKHVSEIDPHPTTVVLDMSEQISNVYKRVVKLTVSDGGGDAHVHTYASMLVRLQTRV